jgi:hypothetical protein
MSSVVLIGHRLTVGFLSLLFVISCANIFWGLVRGTRFGLLIVFFSAVSCLFAGATAWNILYWKPVGRYLGSFIALQHLSFLVNWRGPVALYSKVLTVPVFLMAIWLFLPEVKQKFGPLQKVKWL